MFAFYTFLSSLYNGLLKFVSLIILLGEVAKVLRKGGENFRRGAKSSQGRCAPPPKIRPWLPQNR